MRVLWFVNTPANAADVLASKSLGGGWLRTLDAVLQHKVELHVAFYWPKPLAQFEYGKTVYHPISVKNWKMRLLRSLFVTSIVDDEDLSMYLDIVDKVRPDIIHIHGTENSFGCLIQHTSVPAVVSIQGIIHVIHHKFDGSFTAAQLSRSTATLQNGLKGLLFGRSFRHLKRVFKKMTYREERTLSDSNYIIGRTLWDKRVCSVLAPKAKYFHCDEIMRPKFFEQEWQYRASEKLVLHTTISDSPYKGFETICECLLLLNRSATVRVEWQIAGLNEQSQVVRICKRKFGPAFPWHLFRFLGPLNDDALIRFLRNADLFVLASHIDNSPNSLCEAMLIGMPCIATHAGGIASILADGEEGVLLQDGDPWVLAGAILELHRSQERCERMGRKARARALGRHHSESVTDNLLGIYRSVISDYGLSS